MGSFFKKRTSISEADEMQRLLELSQQELFRVQEENEANKLAHTIVLETKEAVLRSLIQSNSEIAIEVSTVGVRCRRRFVFCVAVSSPTFHNSIQCSNVYQLRDYHVCSATS